MECNQQPLPPRVASALAEDAATLALLHNAEITAPLLTGLKYIGFPGNLSLMPKGQASVHSFALMRQALEALPKPGDKHLLDELAADFAAIYLTGAFATSPCESFWLSEEHLLCQEPMFDLRALYAANGLAAPDWLKRPDDHLVYQLQFLASLMRSAQSDADWRVLASFLDHHLLRWLPEFAGRVADRCVTRFYEALALLTDAWCQQVRDLIACHLGAARPAPAADTERHGAERGAMPHPVSFMPGAGGPSW